MENSTPLFSTKGRYKIGTVFVVIVIILRAFVLIAGLLSIIGIGVGIVAYILLGIWKRKLAARGQSFVTLYDDHVEGKSIPKKWYGARRDMRKFQLEYSDIIHVNSKTGVVTLIFNGGEYDVQAELCEQQVVDLIMKQKKASIQQSV